MISSSWFEFSTTGIGLTVPPVLVAVLVFAKKLVIPVVVVVLVFKTNICSLGSFMLLQHNHFTIIIRCVTPSASSSTDITGGCFSDGCINVVIHNVYVDGDDGGDSDDDGGG